MNQIVVALKDLILDADQPIDLTTLPENEAIARIRDSYAAFGETVDVTIADGMVTISVPETSNLGRSRAEDALRRAGKLANRGKYEQAIALFQEALEHAPDHVSAHRDLAMAYMELNQTRNAKKHLLRAMQLQPNDAWAHVIMGNFYLQYENDLGSAERYYQVAYDLNPNDLYLLNSYGALKGRRNQPEEARAYFEKALDVDPSFPNARYGLAILSEREGAWHAVIRELQALFAQSKSDDPRSEAIYEQARLLFLRANQEAAKTEHDDAMQKLHADIDAYSTGTRFPIVLEADSSIPFTASAQMAWVHGRQEHSIKYKPGDRDRLPHLIAHEFEHIRMIESAVRAGRNRLFATNRETEEYARRSISNDMRKLQRAIADERALQQYLDIMMQEGVHGLEPNIQRSTPSRIWQASVALNCALAFFADFLYNGATAYADAYRKSGQYHNGEKLFHTRQRVRPGGRLRQGTASGALVRLARGPHGAGGSHTCRYCGCGRAVGLFQGARAGGGDVLPVGAEEI